MILTALCLTFIVFFLTNLYPNLEKLAKTQGNQRMSDEAVTSYLGKNGYLQPLPCLLYTSDAADDRPRV